jgi:uncharacterized protein YceH (UPF0502 family)
MSALLLTDVEARVLGCLIEKDMSTPEYYPLSLNALVNACNQKTNREPVVQYSEETVRDAVESLRARQLAWVITGRDMRVPKYSHRAAETLDAGNRELAVLAVLLLRGPQTVAEIKERTQRLHEFDDAEAVEACLRRLAERESAPLVRQLARQPGAREPRWAHLLCGEPAPVAAAAPVAEAREALTERVARLEEEVRQLRAELADLRRLFE